LAKDRETLTILLVCQARPLRIGLRTMLAEMGDQFTILEAASLENTGELPLDSVHLVIIYSGSSSPLGEFRLEQLPPDLPVLWLTADLQMEGIPLSPRPTGILPIEAADEEILASIQALRQGLSIFPPQILNSLFKEETPLSASPLSIDPGKNSSLNPLTTRELEILQALGLGLTNKEIAAKVLLSENTVKFHLAAIFSKLGVNNRTEAVRHGLRAGLITL
jgi:DNA-binding NarL/FixJ family response regulator